MNSFQEYARMFVNLFIMGTLLVFVLLPTVGIVWTVCILMMLMLIAVGAIGCFLGFGLIMELIILIRWRSVKG